MTFFVGQPSLGANNYSFDTWDDYTDMGGSVSEPNLAFHSYDEEISDSSQRVVDIDLLDDEEIPFKMVDSC
ncbi:hypothetical protein JCM33374_g2854 [Metschnikowia sp. JCM 33374]|nr:hypothetical protein JCM33374_g2854 [Metschnikowia sp. JCM 33374]